MRKQLRIYSLSVLALLVSAVGFAQSKITGTIIDSETGEGLPGASILVKGTTNGTITDFNGDFSLSVDGEVTLEISFIGFNTTEIKVDPSKKADIGRFNLEPSANELSALEIIASVAVDRKTPVAVSTIKRDFIIEKAGNQEFPELLKSTPGVYATKQGGGYGDARINVRGFNSENVAVLINGVPVNDMENGRIFWSNWAGLTDVTVSMQVQRGLGASKVAVPSIGGTINILTQNTDAEKGGNLFYGVGNDGYQKGSFYVSTGLSDDGWAFSASAAKITGDRRGGVIGTQFEAYNYFFNVSKVINDKHSLSLTGFGAPQTHGQRQTRFTIQEVRDDERGIEMNNDYGYLDGQLVSVEDNFYHKPQFSLNHYWTISDKTDVSTAFYVSTGTGGGGGVGGTLQRRADGIYDLEATRNINFDNKFSNGGDGSATGWLRASRNDHRWIGVLSTVDHQANSKLNLVGGLDFRYYKGLHFTDLTNQLGADYILDNNDVNNPNRQARLGDKIAYNNDGEVLWGGVFGQAEYTDNKLDIFGSFSVINNSYRRTDHFVYFNDENRAAILSDPTVRAEFETTLGAGTVAEALEYEQVTEWVNFLGFQLKGGGNYRLTRNHNVFVNAGFFTRAPVFNTAFLDFSNGINEEAEVQKILSFELGYGFRSARLSANINAYRTMWMDRTLVERFQVGDTLYTANLLGVDAIHQGVEMDFNYKITNKITLRGMASFGDWTWANDLENVKIFDDLQNEVGEVDLFISGLKVGNSAQTTMALGLDAKLFEGFKLGADLNYFGNNYADYDPNDRGDEGMIGVQPWKIPDFYNIDVNASYDFKLGGNDLVFYGNVFNLLDAEYITDANDADLNSVEVFYGLGRQWTMGLRYKF
ncbi:MAG: carboxypeptidase-like regulatory domain-containing protein [Cyclobacteriaceae bacterium]